MSQFIQTIFEKLREHPKRIVFTDGHDPEVVRGACVYVKNKLGPAILLGKRETIAAIAARDNLCMKRVLTIDPETAQDIDLFVHLLKEIPRYSGIEDTEARETLKNPIYFACMMLRNGQCDGLVAGHRFQDSNLMRPLVMLIKAIPGVRCFSSCMIVDTLRPELGDNGVLFMADASVIAEPTAEQLAGIALETARLKRQLSGNTPRIALLSYSTRGNIQTKVTEKIIEAHELLKDRLRDCGFDAVCDGEIQPDAALIPEVAAIKAADSPLCGKSDVLIFPDMGTGNISIKLLQALVPVRSHGHIITGLLKPAAEIYRGIHGDQIAGVAAIVAMQAIEYRKLYPD